MKILSRYILLESLAYFSICLFAFTGVLLTIRMLRFASLIVNRGVEFQQIAMVFISIIPTFLQIAIPMSTLLGIMLAFARLSKDSEIIVIRASGISIGQLISPVLIFGITAGLISLIVAMQLEPWGHRRLSQTLFEIARSRSTAGLNEGVFNKLGSLTLYTETIDSRTGDLRHVVVDDKRDSERRQIIFAQSGQIFSDEQRQTISFFLRDGVIHEQAAARYITTRYDHNHLMMNADQVFDGEAGRRGKAWQRMSLTELRSSIDQLQTIIADNPDATPETPLVVPAKIRDQPLRQADVLKEIVRFKIEGVRRFSMPFAALVMALIAMPLGIQPPRTQRTWGVGLSLSLGLGVFVCYYAMLSIGMAFAENQKLNPQIALWAPNFTIIAFALYFIRKVSIERWQSMAEGFEKVARLLIPRLQRRTS